MPSWSARLLSSPTPPSRNPVPPGGASTYDAPPKTPPSATDALNTPLHGVPVLQIMPARGSPPTLTPTRRPSHHGRSISHPFPSLFGSARKNERRAEQNAIEEGVDPTEDEVEYDKPLPRTPSQKALAQSTDKSLVAGRCATCGSLVRWPQHLEVYRCTACLMINDLKLPPDTKKCRTPSATSKKDAVPSLRIPRKVLPLSLARTKKLIDECVVNFLRSKICHAEADAVAAQDYFTERSRSASAPSRHFTEVPDWEMHLGAANGHHNNTTGLGARRSPGYPMGEPAPTVGAGTTQPVMSPESFADGAPPAPSRAPPTPPMQGSSQLVQPITPVPESSNSSAAKNIFRPLETYLAACLHDCECLNASFSISKPSHPVRAASEASPLSERPKRTGVFKTYDASLSVLDEKTLLLGDFAENGTWWTGGRRHTQKTPGKSPGSPRDSTDKKIPRFDWNAINDWYGAIYSCGSTWRTQLDDIEFETAAPHLSLAEEQEIDDLLIQGRYHVQRTLLKSIENLLRRPGQPLTVPEDCRFLFIALANPLLYPQHGTNSISNSAGMQNGELKKADHSQLSRRPLPAQRTRSSRREDPLRGGAIGLHSGIIKRILGLIANLSNECHQVFVSWFRRFSEVHFRRLVELVGGFVSYRLSRQGERDRGNNGDRTGGLVPNICGPGAGTSAQLHAALGSSGSAKTFEAKDKNVAYGEDWQIKAAAKVMSLLFSANISGRHHTSDHPNFAPETGPIGTSNSNRHNVLRSAQILPTSAFYNTLLDYSDLIADFDTWESKRGKFTFCQYPMFLSIWAKIHIMEYDARRQMEVKAREAFFNSILSRKAVSQYLVLKVRRDCLVDDSLRGVSEVVATGQEEIKKGLKIDFIGEEGVDAGGLRKEWFLLLVREVFDPEHGLFIYDEESRYCYFNPNSFETSDQFFLVGVVLGLAIYNSTILDVALPPFAFRKLLASAPAYTGPATSSTRASPGYTLDDLAEWKPSLARGLRQLLEYEGNVEDTFCRDFVAEVDRYGQSVQVPLCSNGENRPVTNSNRREFVDLYVRYLLETAVARQYEPFKRGFFTVCGGNALSLFRPEEIELLVRGSDEPLDVESLHAVAIYDGWGGLPKGKEEPVVTWFWEAFAGADAKCQRKILGFITGSDRIPAMGAMNLIIKISYLGEDRNRFPIARTCFNQIGLYRYPTKVELETKLWRAISRNKIPTVDKFLRSLDLEKSERDRRIDEDVKAKAGQPGGDAVAHQASKAKAGTGKLVTDPTTGHQVEIADVNNDFLERVKNPTLSVPNANLGKPTSVMTEPTQSGEEYKRNQDITAPPDPVAPNSTSDVPIHGEKTNILFHPTPSVSYEPMFASLEKQAGGLCIGVFLAVVILGKMFGGTLFGLIPLAACIVSGIWLWVKELIRSGREVQWSSEQERGQTAVANLLPESVEWMNHLLEIVWGLINPDMFAGVADTLEDVMQASVPGVIESVRVAEINQGNNPIRILSLRALPDSHVKELKDSIHEENKKTKDPQEAAADEEGGDYYNIEVSFAYHAKPAAAANASAKARNLHMELVFYLGMKGLFGVPLPIFVELQSLVGTVRLRLQMTPEPPYAKNLTFTLMGTPQVTAGCVPMIKKGPNILNLPLITNFVNYAIGAAASMYVAPKSMSLDLGAMLSGDDVQKEVQALGVMWIRIHKAVGLSKQDRRGSKHGGSDPYINLSFSKYGKPMYCTRVITDDLNPVWEETAALLVNPELIKADEQLSVELWDSDRSSADDIVGKVELSMQKMIQHPGKMYPQVSKLKGMEVDSEMPGELHWEVGYFSKPKLRPALRTDGKDMNLPDALKDHPALQDDQGVINNEHEDAVIHTPPDPLWPSGICSVIIHQIVSLELENIQGSNGKRKGREYEPAKEYGENTEEESKKLPSSYCTILLNDQLVYRTRSKAVSSKPIFNAGTERFVRDWRSAIVTVTVRDSRYRQHDPILGVVPLRLSDILNNRSQVTRWYPLDGGVGFGRIRISLLFRSVELRLPPNMLGWDVGTFEFLCDRILATGYHSHAKLKLRTGGSTGAIGKTQCRSLEEGDGMFWDIAKKDGKNNIRLPVRFRYRSPVVFEFHTAGKRGAQAYAILWLHHLTDNEPAKFNLPIWTTKQGARLCQNYVTEENIRAKDLTGLDDVQEVGRLHFRCQFKAGTDESHEQFVVDNDTRETFETWECCLAEGVRERKVSVEVPPSIQELHDKSLTQDRDVLEQADPEEKKKWLAKDGQDWSGAFGHDPKAYMDSSGRKRAEPGKDKPVKDPIVPADHDHDIPSDNSYDDSDDSDSDADALGVQDATNATHATGADGSAEHDGDTDVGGGADESRAEVKRDEKVNKRSEKRKQRGLMQWKPVRNLEFAKNETKFALRRVKHRMTGGLGGREPDVETEV